MILQIFTIMLVTLTLSSCSSTIPYRHGVQSKKTAEDVPVTGEISIGIGKPFPYR